MHHGFIIEYFTPFFLELSPEETGDVTSFM